MKEAARQALGICCLALAFAALGQAGVLDQVRSRAPALVGFAGSQDNFVSLVSGLANVAPVELRTDLGNGYMELASFTPPGAPMAADEIIAALRAGRERLEDFGVSNPSASEIAATLMGGIIQRPTGMFRLRGTLPQSGQGFEQDYVVRTQYTGPGAGALARFAGSPANLQSLIAGLTTGSAISLRGTSLTGLPETATFTIPVPPTTRVEALRLLERARGMLRRHGIYSPAPLQIRAALLGGTVQTPAGTMDLAGVLDARRGLPGAERYPP